MCSAMPGDGPAEKMKTVPLLDTTVALRITEMSENVHEQLITRLQVSGFKAG